MLAKNGRMLSGYYCAKNSPAEVEFIIEMGIKKGVCSLSLAEDESRVGGKHVRRKRT